MKFYTKRFYQNQMRSSLASAKEIIPFIIELVNPASVVDIGCGVGTWLNVFQKKGIKNILGIDGSWIDEEMLLIPKNKFLHFDLKKKMATEKKYDLVISLEVAEHISKKHTKNYIKTLVNHGPVILFSAAIPLQGGSDHVNEQWPEYWISFFANEKYLCVDCIRERIWKNKKIEFWYKQNILLFVQEDYLKNNRRLLSEYARNKSNQFSMVHPEAFLSVANRLNFFVKLIPLNLKRTLGQFIDHFGNKRTF